MTAPLTERDFVHIGNRTCSIRAEEIAASKAFREAYGNRPNLVVPEDMPFEQSPDGLIKHLVHNSFGTPECCVEAYMQFLEPDRRTGRHRHMWEEIAFVVEGSGYDLHWDLKYDCNIAFEWDWEPEPRRFEWKRGDFIYVPPFTIHQHCNSADSGEARLIVISNRLVKEMGFNWIDQLDEAPAA